jgi:hypothetical protein
MDMDAVPDDSDMGVRGVDDRAKGTTGDNPLQPAQARELADEGDFLVRWEAPTNSYYEPWQRRLQDSEIFEGFRNLLNAEFKLPHDVMIVHRECGASDAYYDADSASVVMCYELIDQLACSFSVFPSTEEQLAAVHSWVFTFFHETGHALIDVYDLPVTDEEEAADQFATLILIDAGYSEEVQLASAQFPLEMDALPAYVGEHGQPKQRFFGTSCLLYGSDPEQWLELPAQWPQLASQTDLCVASYAEKAATWDLLLADWHQ